MNNEEAKKTLSLFRPGTADRTDPAFADALQRVRPHAPPDRWQEPPDPELIHWFHAHCASYLSFRTKFARIPVPPGLKDQILAERKNNVVTPVAFRRVFLLRLAAVLAICAGLASFLWPSHSREEDFATYRSRMIRTALQPYSMDLQSHDLQDINAYLAGRNAPDAVALPKGVGRTQPVGCAVLKWQGAPVSMLCFQSGHSLPAGQESDLWLFVVDKSAVRNGPAAVTPLIAQVKKLATASWVQDEKVYILAADGNESFLRKYL